MSDIDRVNVGLAARSYEIVVGAGVLDRAGELMRPVLRRPRAVVISDETVAGLYRERFSAALDSAAVTAGWIVVPAGEGTKTFAALEDVVGRMLDLRVERATPVIALGGGVVGDLGGFAASVTLRGLDVIQVPTTLLSQVDSSVGGKTGINTRHGKNLVGAFHQPRLVLADTGVLDTLPRRQRLAGYAEIVKYGLIDDAGFFDWLTEHGRQVCDGDGAARRQAIVTSCRAKARIVAEDERESGRRALLNLGHTFGHALEAEAGYGDGLLHGEAVAVGMVMAFDLSVRLGLCPAADAERVRRHLADIGLPTTPSTVGLSCTPASLLAHMQQDKKVRDGRIAFVLVRGIGQAFIAEDVDTGTVVDLLTDAIAA